HTRFSRDWSSDVCSCDLTTFSIPIDAVIAMAEAEGNQVIEISTGWEKVRQLVYMARPMSEKLRTAVTERYPLRFWSADATPHDRSDDRRVGQQRRSRCMH